MKHKFLIGITSVIILTGLPVHAEEMTASQAINLQMTACLTGGQQAHDAEQVLRTAAALDDLWAQEALATYLQNRGGTCKSTPSLKEAMRYHRKAADAGLPEAAMSLGDMYMNGEGVHRNTAEAAKWYKKAALEISQQVPDGFFSQPILSGSVSQPSAENIPYNGHPMPDANGVFPSQYAQVPAQQQLQKAPIDPCSQEGTTKMIQIMQAQNPAISGQAMEIAVDKARRIYNCGSK